MKILIVKIGAIGDVVMALPLLVHIRKKYPEAKITWLCGHVVRDFLLQFSEIDELISIDEKLLLSNGLSGKFRAIPGIWKSLLFRKFDQILYFYFSDLYKILILPVRYSTLLRFEKGKTKRQNPIPGRHHTIDYISTFEQNNGPFSYPLEYPKFRYQNLEFELLKAKSSPKKWIVISCGGAKNILRDDDLRRWPIEHYVTLGKRIENAGYQLVLSGAPSDNWVEEHFRTIPHISFIGKLNLNDFVVMLKSADVLITHDSGPLHLADLASCPVLGIFGPTIPEEKISLQSKSKFIWGGAHLHCRPCYDGRTYAACQDNQCMKSISPAEVFEVLEKMIVA